MIEWWSSLGILMKILWGITAAASLIFVIQTVLTFLGVDGDLNADFDVDTGGANVDMAHGDSGMGLLTFRNFVNFFLGFGWTAILLHDQIASIPVLLTVAVVIGVGLVAVVMLLFKWVSGMQQSGNINVFTAAEGCQGKVYLKVPAARTGEGKVQITINNSVREYNAVTDGEELPTGTPIWVVEVVNENTLLVEKTNSIIV